MISARVSTLKGWLGKRALLLILLVGTVHGLLYVFVVPPWQHYDEPTHLEYAWLIADRLTLPQRGDFDQTLRRAIAASMLETGFFDRLGFRPDLLAASEPVWIGISQVDGPPLYYLLVALPLRAVRHADVVLQLHLARLVSLGLFLLTLLAARGMVCELTSEGSVFRWLVPLTLALLPGFVDIMTAVNDDVGATVAFALFLWAGVVLLRRGFSRARLAALALTAVACLAAKSTVYMALPLAAFVLLLALLPPALHKYALVALAAAGLAGLPFILGWGDAALWYRVRGAAVRSQIDSSSAPIGPGSIRLAVAPGAPLPDLAQPLLSSALDEIRGRTVTLGAWIWSADTSQALLPVFHYIDSQKAAHLVPLTVDIGATPGFHAATVEVPSDVQRAWIRLQLPKDVAGKAAEIYYDGILLVPGAMPTDMPPIVADVQCSSGTWGGAPFRNLARNASAERTWPRVRSWAESIGARVFPGKPPVVLAALLDWQGARWYFLAAGSNIVRTFWATFGWGGVPLGDGKLYPALGLITAIGLAGAPFALWRRRRKIRLDIAVFLGAAVSALWLLTLLRGTESLSQFPAFIPGSRYASPVVPATLLLLTLGWHTVLSIPARFVRPWRWVPAFVFVTGFLCLDVLSLASIVRFFTRSA